MYVLRLSAALCHKHCCHVCWYALKPRFIPGIMYICLNIMEMPIGEIASIADMRLRRSVTVGNVVTHIWTKLWWRILKSIFWLSVSVLLDHFPCLPSSRLGSPNVLLKNHVVCWSLLCGAWCLTIVSMQSVAATFSQLYIMLIFAESCVNCFVYFHLSFCDLL